MRYTILTLLFLVFVSNIYAQTHQEALKEFDRLKSEIEAIKEKSDAIEKVLLQPDKADIAAAKEENLNVFRILPREIYDKDVLKIRGGGAYYSFTKQSNNYGDIPQISLEQNSLSVGFYGASYGFLTDLGNISLSEINQDSAETNFLIAYMPPDNLPAARIEQQKVKNFEFENKIYKDRLPVIVGNTYLLRAISYREADTLVALKVFRKDSDGSLVIFWKEIKNFEKPFFATDNQKVSITNASFDGAIAAKIQDALKAKGFTDVQVSTEKNLIVLRGSVPKDKMADAIMIAQEISQRPIKNELFVK